VTTNIMILCRKCHFAQPIHASGLRDRMRKIQPAGVAAHAEMFKARKGAKR
jgi:5-methylcytosine-specific restriction endonuclease McrA